VFFQQFVDVAVSLVPSLPKCSHCTGKTDWVMSETDTLRVDLTSLQGRKLDVQLPMLSCPGCGASRAFAALEVGCFCITPTSFAPSAKKVRSACARGTKWRLKHS
jgi:hypothetical protein